MAVRKWSIADEETLMKQFQDNTSMETIATNLNRTVGACGIRLKKLACQFHSEGQTFDEILKKTGISQEAIEEQLKIDARVQQKKLTSQSALIKAKLKEIESLLS